MYRYVCALAVSWCLLPSLLFAQASPAVTTSGVVYVRWIDNAFVNALTLDAANKDVIVVRDAAGVLALRNGTAPQGFRIYNTYTDASNFERLDYGWASDVGYLVATSLGSGQARELRVGTIGAAALTLLSGNATRVSINGTSGRVALTAPAITAGSVGSITATGDLQSVLYKITLASTLFTCNDVICDLTIATLPAATWLDRVTVDLATTFACAATCTTASLSFVLGKGGGGAEYIASFDADAATGTFGDADAELGTTLVRAAAVQGGTFTAGTQAVVLRLISGVGNIGNGATTNLSQGSITVWIETTRLP